MPKLHRVELPARQILLRADAPIEQVYFPEEGLISLVTVFGNDGHAEVGVIGSEGMFGVFLLAGVATTFTEAVVQMSGQAIRISSGDFSREIGADGPLRSLLLRYYEALACQVSQTAACNGHHGIEARLARWLLMAHDRMVGDELSLTQDFLAMMLGVHRPSLTVSAGVLQRKGLITHSSTGRVTILDREGLEDASCECYAVIRRRFTTIMGPKFYGELPVRRLNGTSARTCGTKTHLPVPADVAE